MTWFINCVHKRSRLPSAQIDTFEKLPLADSQVYERIFDIFCKLKTFENLPVADSQVYERLVEVFF